jgi:hypothetical protein
MLLTQTATPVLMSSTANGQLMFPAAHEQHNTACALHVFEHGKKST